MNSILDRYLDRVLIYANKPPAESAAIRQELRDHILQKIDDLVAHGMAREEALLDALRQHGAPREIGYKMRDPFPWIDIRSSGTARGVIAIGPKAVGIFAFGGVAVGVVACGTFAVGLFGAGFLAIGLLWAWAFLGASGIVTAYASVGVVATGAWACGLVAVGDTAIGLWAPETGLGHHVLSHYSAENVPFVLRSLESTLQGCALFERYVFTIFLPIYLLLIFALGYLRYRESKRVAAEDDWLIDG